jgi:hypothetical protein
VKEKVEKKEEAFILSPLIVLAILLRVDKKRALIIKILEAKKTLKRGIR